MKSRRQLGVLLLASVVGEGVVLDVWRPVVARARRLRIGAGGRLYHRRHDLGVILDGVGVLRPLAADADVVPGRRRGRGRLGGEVGLASRGRRVHDHPRVVAVVVADDVGGGGLALGVGVAPHDGRRRGAHLGPDAEPAARSARVLLRRRGRRRPVVGGGTDRAEGRRRRGSAAVLGAVATGAVAADQVVLDERDGRGTGGLEAAAEGHGVAAALGYRGVQTHAAAAEIAVLKILEVRATAMIHLQLMCFT